MKWLDPKIMKFYAGAKMAPETMLLNGYLPYEGTLPADRLMVRDGEIIELPEPPVTEDWQSMSVFIGGLHTLISEDQLMQIMGNPALLKDFVAGMALLSSDLTQAGEIDMMNPLVIEFASKVGLTVEQIKMAMEAYKTAMMGAQNV